MHRISEELLLTLLFDELQNFIFLGLKAFIALNLLSGAEQVVLIAFAHVVGLTVILQNILHHFHSFLLESPLELLFDFLRWSMLPILHGQS